MRISSVLSLILIAATTPAAHAGEGLWRPAELPAIATELEAAGLAAGARALADPGGYPLGAVVDLGQCSGAFVSPDGLVLTAHHCVQRMLQYNSTSQRNLLEGGYLAAEPAAELPAPGQRLRITVATSDVTAPMTAGLDAAMDGLARQRALQQRELALTAACERTAGRRCTVHARHAGLQYLLVETLEIRDVRLVNAPPRSIGRYGGDVDNWTWPRHTGDYAFVRAYVAADGAPADYDARNVAFRPPRYLAVASAGPAAGDFVMTAGYPDRTGRHRLAAEASAAAGWEYPARRTLYADLIATIERAIDGRAAAALAYAPSLQQLDNQSRKLDGMIAGFARHDLPARKRGTESALQAWLDTQSGAVDKDALRRLRELVAEYQAGREQRLLYDELLRGHAALLAVATRLYRFSRARALPDSEREPGLRARDAAALRADLQRAGRQFDAQVDRAVLQRLLEHHAALPDELRSRALDDWFDRDPAAADLATQLERMYAGTLLDDDEVRLAWLDAAPEEFESSGDPFIRLAVHLYPEERGRAAVADRFRGRFRYARARYMEALIAWHAARDVPLYADADGTLRVSFGRVTGYRPRDGVIYEPFTTLAGIVQKNRGVPPFDAPVALLAAISQRSSIGAADRAPLPVNFLASLDVTGGSAGAAVLDADARLVGLVFDLTREAIDTDWYYTPGIAGSICVDLRYAIWVMETVDGAGRLLREMGIGPSTLHGRQLPAGVN